MVRVVPVLRDGRLSFTSARHVSLADAGAVYARIDAIRVAWIAACRGGPVSRLPRCLRAAAQAANAARAARRALGYGTESPREPRAGNVAARAIRRALDAALDRARFRCATHAHETIVCVVARGNEAASSTVSRVNPRSVGLCNAYARVAFSVASSCHEFAVSAAILQAPRSERGVLWLSPELRVRQGRGTALVVERGAAAAVRAA